MTNYLTFTLILLIFFAKSIVGQEKCECCTYNSFDKRNLFESFFEPNIINLNNIDTAIILTKEKYNDTLNNYIQGKFIFNDKGYVDSKIEYFGGNPNSISEYERDSLNNITKIIFTYLDSNENKSNSMSPKVRDLKYNKDNRLIKIKERDYDGNLNEDSISNYTLYEYQDSRKVKILHHFYWKGNDTVVHNYNKELITYIDANESESKVYIDNILFLTITRHYDSFGKVIDEEVFNERLNSLAISEKYTYSNSGKILTYNVTSGDGAGTECPDGDNYNENYIYEQQGLISEIIHEFEGVQCIMTVEYK
jgi:hypothetical protein